jgi:hypothetical protein
MAKKLPKVSILDRRLANPFGLPSDPIHLKNGRWAVRWFAESVRSGRVYQGQQLGWTFVEPTDLTGDASDIGALVVDNRVVRGDAAHREVLMKMPQAEFAQIQRAKAEKNLADMGSSKKTSEKAANLAAKQFGDEAGEAVYRSNMEITDSRAQYDLEDEAPAT